MGISVTVTVGRRSQAERRATTRQSLLDATIACLTKDGYARMSTNDVVKLAGVSRGALVHHFPTKAELAVAALDGWLDSRIAEFEEEFATLPTNERRAPAAIDVMWTLFKGPTFAAWLDLAAASRTDKRLRSKLIVVESKFYEGVLKAFRRSFSANDEIAPFDPGVAVRFALTVLIGAAVERMLQPPAAGDMPESVVALKLLAAMPFNSPVIDTSFSAAPTVETSQTSQRITA